MVVEALFASIVPEGEGEFGEELEAGHSSNPMTMSHSYFATNTCLTI